MISKSPTCCSSQKPPSYRGTAIETDPPSYYIVMACLDTIFRGQRPIYLVFIRAKEMPDRAVEKFLGEHNAREPLNNLAIMAHLSH
jgi:hypothetical protein